MRDGYTRARDIEKAAAAFVSWCDEFVGEVFDHKGNSLTASGEWGELLDELYDALLPLEEERGDRPRLPHRPVAGPAP